jgi:transcriptional regulator with XRE-family HTH domain
MAARQLSTRGLAVRSGINHSTIYRLARGDREPSLATAVALLKILGTRIADAPAEMADPYPAWQDDFAKMRLAREVGLESRQERAEVHGSSR